MAWNVKPRWHHHSSKMDTAVIEVMEKHTNIPTLNSAWLNLNAPQFTHTGGCKPFTSKLHAFAKQNHPPGKVRTSNPELRRLANDRGHVHAYYQNLEKLSAPLFSSNQSDLVRSVKKSVRISLKKSGYLSLTSEKTFIWYSWFHGIALKERHVLSATLRVLCK